MNIKMNKKMDSDPALTFPGRDSYVDGVMDLSTKIKTEKCEGHELPIHHFALGQLTVVDTGPASANGKNPQVVTDPESAREDPQAATDPESTGDDPQVDTDPESTGDDPQVDTDPESAREDPQADTDPEYTGEDPQADTDPESAGEDPDVDSGPDSAGEVPQVQTDPAPVGEEPQVDSELPDVTQIKTEVCEGHELPIHQFALGQLTVVDTGPALANGKDPQVDTDPEAVRDDPQVDTDPDAVGEDPQVDTSQASDGEDPLQDVMFECQLCKLLSGDKESLIQHVQAEHPDHPDVEEIVTNLQKNDKDCQIPANSVEFKPASPSPTAVPQKRKRRIIDHRISCLHPGCGKVFQTAGALKTHSVCHEIMKDCIHCGVIFGTATALIRHIDRRHNPKNVVRLPCTYCNEVFRHQTVLDKHIARHARSLKVCSHCNQGFNLKRQLNEHIRLMHSADGSTLQLMCQNCGIPMADNRSLIKHMASTCLLSDGLVCEFEGCGEIFYSRQAIQNHRRRHLQSENETDLPHACPNAICGQRFLSKKKLKIHLRVTQHDVNVDELPFVCLFRSCAKRFVSKQDVIAHMKAIHWGNKKRLAALALKNDGPKKPKRSAPVGSYVKCPVCQKRFSTDVMMRYHIKTKHAIPSTSNGDEDKTDDGKGELDTENNEDQSQFYVFDLKMYRCPECHSSYHSAGRLKSHIETQHQNLGDAQGTMLKKLDSDSESFVDVVKTTLSRDCQYINGKPRIRNRKKKGSGNNQTPASDISLNSSLEPSTDAPDSMPDLLDDETVSKGPVGGPITDDNPLEATSPKSDQYFCRYPSCNEKYGTKFELIRHQKTHKRNLKCSHEGCNAEFFSMVNLRGHIKLVHGSTEVATCQQCGRVGKGKSFKKHMEDCKESSPLYVCQLCGKAFAKKSSRKNHMLVHKEKTDKHLKACTFEGCTKKFKSNQDLSRHMNVHTGDRPHKCPYGGCPKTYKQRPHLLVHLKTHSVLDDGKEKQVFPCDYCGFPFKHRCGKLKHVRNSCVKGPNKDIIIDRISKRRRKFSARPDVSETGESS